MRRHTRPVAQIRRRRQPSHDTPHSPGHQSELDRLACCEEKVEVIENVGPLVSDAARAFRLWGGGGGIASSRTTRVRRPAGRSTRRGDHVRPALVASAADPGAPWWNNRRRQTLCRPHFFTAPPNGALAPLDPSLQLRPICPAVLGRSSGDGGAGGRLSWASAYGLDEVAATSGNLCSAHPPEQAGQSSAAISEARSPSNCQAAAPRRRAPFVSGVHTSRSYGPSRIEDGGVGGAPPPTPKLQCSLGCAIQPPQVQLG